MPVRPGQPSCRSRLLDRSSWAHDGRLAHEQCRQADPISYRLLKRKTREEKDLVGATPAQPCARRRRGGVFSTAATCTIMVSAPRRYYSETYCARIEYSVFDRCLPCYRRVERASGSVYCAD